MPFQIRKSVRAGPFRFNFSRGGVGVSVGVKGLRIGTGPRGHYVHAGMNGIYYRASLGASKKHQRNDQDVDRGESAPELIPGSVEMVEIDSGDVEAMHDEKFDGLLADLNEKKSKRRLGRTYGLICVMLAVAGFFLNAAVGTMFLIAALPMVLIGRRLDSYRRATVIFYELDHAVTELYGRLVNAFDRISECNGTWHIESSGKIQDLATWKQNAGATDLVSRKHTRLRYTLPSTVRCNITPPSMAAGKQTLYFFPDGVLIEDNKRFGAVSYDALGIDWVPRHFIEDGKVPSDAEIVGQTWKHPNKQGGPDRRFRDNHEIPVCLYEDMHLSSHSGLNELLQFSCAGVAEPFARACAALPSRGGQIDRQIAE